MKKKKRLLKLTSFTLIFLSAFALFSILGIYFYAESNIDYSVDEQLFIGARAGNSTKFYYDETFGRGKYTPRELCPTVKTQNRKNWYEYDEIGENLKSAFIAVEDRGFFKHSGVDVKRTCFAAFNYLFHIKPKFGASTITQQLIKNISGDSEQTLQRKFSEILRAINIEKNHTKEEIFEVYLNVIPMGNGIVGVGAAAEAYFGKMPNELTSAEAATIVGITNAPGRYNPITNPSLCKEKRNSVLSVMYEFGVIDSDEYKESLESPFSINDDFDIQNDVNSWLIETICDDIAVDLAKAKKISKSAARLMLSRGGFSVYTTANPKVQGVLERYFENEDNFPEAIKSGLQYSMVVLDSKSGNLLGIVGGVGQKRANLILNYALLPITPGSSLKPLALYAPALDKKYVNWATVFDDVPVEFKKSGDGEYIAYPKNYPQVYDGLTTLSDALRLSKNTVAIRLYNLLGKDNIFNNLRSSYGFDLISSKTLSGGGILTDKASSPLALGQLTYGIPLKSLVGAYTVFPRCGEVSKPKSYISVYDSSGNLFLESDTSAKRVLSRESAEIMNQMLMRVTESGTAKTITLGNIVDTAGKTGTSGNDKDRVFVGYTPYCTAGIWCGYAKRENSIGSQAITHLDVWDDVMREIHEIILDKEEQIESFPCDGLVRLPFCKDSGKMFSEYCIHDPRSSRLEYGYFTKDNKPCGRCDRHVLCLYDELTGALASEKCPKEYVKLVALLDISDRAFPKEIYVTDAEYVYRKMQKGIKYGDSYDVPYFKYSIEDGEFVGISKKRKQYNSYCYLHS